MILLGLLRPYGRDETVARIVLSSSIDCFGLNRTQVVDSGLIIFLNEFRNRYHARSRFRPFPGDWFRRCSGLRGASAVRKPNSLLPCVPLNISWFAQGIGMLEAMMMDFLLACGMNLQFLPSVATTMVCPLAHKYCSLKISFS